MDYNVKLDNIERYIDKIRLENKTLKQTLKRIREKSKGIEEMVNHSSASIYQKECIIIENADVIKMVNDEIGEE